MRGLTLDHVLSHWSKLVENFSTSSRDFYEAVDQALDRRSIPEVHTRRVAWNEGGVLSPHREYFRIEGSGFTFDLCAAPFGNAFFFSWWLTQKRPELVWVHLFLFFSGVWGISRMISAILEDLARSAQSTMDPVSLAMWFVIRSPFVIGGIALFTCLALVGLMERAGVRDPGAALGLVPGLGWIYERLFSPVTYYRLDTAAMFRATVQSAVNEVIDDLLVRKGLRALRPEEQKPQLDGVEPGGRDSFRMEEAGRNPEPAQA